jgi:predicted aminopeptidase
MIPDGNQALGQLANTVIHESVHATVYIKGEAYFNESIAMWVAGKLTPIYLDRARGAESPEKTAYVKQEGESEARELRLHDAYERLNSLYESGKPDGEKLEEKSKIFTSLRQELKIKREINNATLVQYKEYSVPTKEYQELFEACGSDWKRFWATLLQLKASSFQQPQQVDIAPVLGSLKATCR